MVINRTVFGLQNLRVLPPGHVLSFGYMLGERYFAKPGIYTVRWWGDKFKAEPITFRVLPDGTVNGIEPSFSRVEVGEVTGALPAIARISDPHEIDAAADGSLHATTP